MHPVFHLVARGEEQHRHLAPPAAQAFEHLPAVEPGQHHVQDHQVVLAFECQVQAIVARGEVHDEAGLAQALPQVVARLGFVFDDQDFHDS